jgi:hypothetical protein
MKALMSGSATLALFAMATSAGTLTEVVQAAMVLLIPTVALLLKNFIELKSEELKSETRLTRQLIINAQRGAPRHTKPLTPTEDEPQ